MTDFKEYILEHYKKYPLLKIEDVFKFIFQGAFGCEHMLPSLDTVSERICREYKQQINSDHPLVEELSDKYCRVHLSYISQGLSCSTLGKLFFLSAQKEDDGLFDLEKMLQDITELTNNGLLPFSKEALEEKIYQWRENRFCALHHSDDFHSLYSPQYRVISKKYLPFLPLFARIDTLLEKGKLTVAIDGGSASGKTTLSALLSKLYDATVFHMDDFFLTPDMRTSQRLKEVGGNVDRERFLLEVLTPLSKDIPVSYRPFNCSTGKLMDASLIVPKKLVIVEGAYSMHPELSSFYGLSAFLDIDKDKQHNRILKRNTPFLANRFFNEWIPLENVYFEKTQIKKRCDLVITV